MNYSEITKVNFELNKTTTWGVKTNKYGGYTIPVILDQNTINKIRELVKEYDTKDPIYGNILYLKVKDLSPMQEKDLLNKGEHEIMIHFGVHGTYGKYGACFLVFKVTKLGMLFKPEDPDDIPEDY